MLIFGKFLSRDVDSWQAASSTEEFLDGVARHGVQEENNEEQQDDHNEEDDDVPLVTVPQNVFEGLPWRREPQE